MGSGTVGLSVLDLVPIVAGGTASEALANSLDLAQHAEKWGYRRYWIAEHHNMPGIASSATSVVIGYIAAGTSRIRVGSGGIMLPNHAPLVIAEQFGTLESLFPGRIDLGLGRAPGGDPLSAKALRRSFSSGEEFPQDLLELRSYFEEREGGRTVRAVPGEGLQIPIWLLGSSDFSARLAARLGLPFAFASHFAPDYLHSALAIYRGEFQPSSSLERPYAMVAVNGFVADTDEEAEVLFSSLLQTFLNLVRGTPGKLAPPVTSMDGLWSLQEREAASRMVRYSAVGSPATAKARLDRIAGETQADELIVSSHIYDHRARLRSYRLLAEAWNGTHRASSEKIF
ncbi:MAG TPA: LLM class flavin-dependent oxidoreductase [Fimbriimonas sp.]